MASQVIKDSKNMKTILIALNLRTSTVILAAVAHTQLAATVSLLIITDWGET